MPQTFRILIVGAGALGGFYGARLLAAGRDVTFLVRPARAQALAAEGLTLTSPNGNLKLHNVPTLLAAQLAASPQPFDLILLTCKSPDLASAIEDLAPAIGPNTAILPVLNGLAHLATLDACFGRPHIFPGGCNISATRAPDGSIAHFNSLDRLFFGDRDDPASPRVLAVQSALAHANFQLELSPVIMLEMWQKWVFIATSAGITCLLRGSVGQLVAAGAAPLALSLLTECAAIATHAGYPPTEPALERARRYITQPGSTFKASMLRDLEAGAPIEAHQIIGDLLTHARAAAIPTPILEIVHAHLRTYEEARNLQL